MMGKIDFMVTNVSTPYGITVQYFDQAVSGDIWLQIPVYKNIYALRLDAKGFAPIFRDSGHEWEVGSIFTPMVRLIANF